MVLKKSHIFNSLSLLIMGRLFLLILFENLPLPISPFYFITIGWVAALAFFYPAVLVSKKLISIYVLILLYVLLDCAGVYDFDYRWVFIHYFIPLFLSISIYTYYMHVRDYRGLSYLVFFSLIFIMITALTTIIGIESNPMVARVIGGKLQGQHEYELLAQYKKMGIATFGFFTGIAFAFPVMIASLKQKWKKRWRKYLFIAGLILLLYAYVKAQYTAALLFALGNSFMALVWNKNKTKSFVIASALLIILICINPIHFFINQMGHIAGYLESDFLQKRICDLGMFLEHGEIYQGADTHVGHKLSRILILIESIKENPFFGGGVNLGHNFWFDWLSQYGIIGVAPWVVIITQQVRYNLKLLSKDHKYYYLLSMFSFIFFGFINALRGSQIYAVVFIIIPGMFYLFPALRAGDSKLKDKNE